jgi:monofunctional biosynthetic peptidoglycan transglycosylase
MVLPILLLSAFRFLQPPPTPLMLLRALVEGASMDQRWIDYGIMSPHLVRAVVAAEDARFLLHRGFDWVEVERALEERGRGGRLRGASTISMQCARTLFLWPGRSMLRKAIEAYVTLLMETLWPKRRIIEVYLNLVEWGDGIYGCEAAAQRHLRVSCSDLSPENGARLAAILPSPRRWSASQPGPYVSARTSTILSRMPHVQVPPG